MAKISELSDGGSLLPTDYLIAVRSGGNVKVQADTINVDQIDLGDNEKIRLGNSQDLQIYHDGTNSVIKDAGAGNLQLNAGSFVLNNAADSANMIIAIDGGATTLYHAGSAKIATTSTGIDVTGTLVSDGLTVDGNISMSGAGTGSRYVILGDETNTYAGSLLMQAGGGSAAYGGSIIAYGHSHASKAGDIVAGISSGSGGSFRVNTSGLDDGADVLVATASGNVGIGTSGPDYNFHVTGTGDTIAAVTAGASSVAGLNLGNSTNKADGGIRYDNSADALIFRASNAEKVRLDASGNLLVGMTNPAPVSNNVQGVSIRSFGELQSSRDGAATLFLNRKGSAGTENGDVVVFRSNGSTVGSIGTKSNDLTIGTGDTGVQFYDFGNSIVPTNLTTNTNIDATIDLGLSGTRFKDLYLSGGVYVGGTGAANYLDDYEEGTWTPTGNGVTLTSPSGTYTKIGRLVTVTWQFVYATSASGSAAQIDGLPFTMITNYNNGGNHAYINGSSAASTAHITGFTNSIAYRTANGGTSLTHADLSGATIRGTMFYMTS